MNRDALVTELRAIEARLKELEAEAKPFRTVERGDDVDTYLWSAASRIRHAVRLLTPEPAAGAREERSPEDGCGGPQEACPACDSPKEHESFRCPECGVTWCDECTAKKLRTAPPSPSQLPAPSPAAEEARLLEWQRRKALTALANMLAWHKTYHGKDPCSLCVEALAVFRGAPPPAPAPAEGALREALVEVEQLARLLRDEADDAPSTWIGESEAVGRIVRALDAVDAARALLSSPSAQETP